MNHINLYKTLKRKPYAVAYINGSPDFPSIKGIASFHQTISGTVVTVYVSGLPKSDHVCDKSIFAMHIHSGGSCSGNESDHFSDALTHYNPDGCMHPYHAGDLPPLFGVEGAAFCTFLTDRFSINEIIGKTVIIHAGPDDFTTQPAGNSGKKIACGVIQIAR